MRRGHGTYPHDWREIAKAVKDAAEWRCVRCGHPHDPKAGRCLTVHHLDMDKSNCRWWNIPALCQACHLSIQGRVDMARPWVMTEHSEWFKPYVAGYYASIYLGANLERDEVMARLGELLDIQRAAILGAA